MEYLTYKGPFILAVTALHGTGDFFYTRNAGRHDLTRQMLGAHTFATYDEAEAELQARKRGGTFEGCTACIIPRDVPRGWLIWRRILDRIVANRLYAYSTPWHLKKPLLQMADFATREMAHYNNLYWKDQDRKAACKARSLRPALIPDGCNCDVSDPDIKQCDLHGPRE